MLLRKNGVETIHGVDQEPGAGGWPTIRHFNTQTGYGGKKYPKKTAHMMCDELGPEEQFMRKYIEEQGDTVMCNMARPEATCTEKQQKFVKKWLGKPSSEFQKQIERLQTMMAEEAEGMSPEAIEWNQHRIGIFRQLLRTAAGKDEL